MTGFFREAERSLDRCDRVRDQAIEVHDVAVGGEVFQREAVGRCRDQVRVDFGRPVRRHRHIEPGRHLRDPPPLSHPAADRRVRLQDVDRTLVEELPERPARRFEFAGGERDRRALRQLGEVGRAVRKKGFLEPPGIVGREAFRRAERVDQVRPRVVGVEGEAPFRSDHFAREPDPGRVDREGASPHLDLHGVEAAREIGADFRLEVLQVVVGGVVAARGVNRDLVPESAEQPVEGHAGELGVEVPERDIEGAHGA